MNQCKDCRFWSATQAELAVANYPRGRVLCHCLKADMDDSGMLVDHGIDGRQQIFTLNSFGCIQWGSRP